MYMTTFQVKRNDEIDVFLQALSMQILWQNPAKKKTCPHGSCLLQVNFHQVNLQGRFNMLIIFVFKKQFVSKELFEVD